MLGLYGSRLSLPGAFAWLIITLSLAGLVAAIGTCFDYYFGMLELGLTALFGWFLVLAILLLCRVRWSCALMSISFHILLLTLILLLITWFHSRDDGILGWFIWTAQCLMSLSLPLLAIRILHSQAMAEHFNPPLRGFAGLVWLVLAVGIVGIIAYVGITYRQVIPLLLAKASPKVDYLAQYNEATRPADYDPNANAATYYDRFFEVFEPLPTALEGDHTSWPTELTENQQRILADWSGHNDEALKSLDQALAQPYYWVEFESLTTFSGIDLAEYEEPRRFTWAMMLWAKHHAERGDIERGIELALKLHRVGIHVNSRPTYVEQCIGIAQCQMAYKTLRQIMDRYDLTADQYQRIHDGIAEGVEQIRGPRFSVLDEYVRKDRLQRFFTDDGNGNGRLLPRVLYKYKNRNADYYPEITFREALNVCRTHPDRQETERQYEQYCEQLQPLAAKTPWEIAQEDSSYYQSLRALVEGNYFLQTISSRTDEVIELSYQARALGRAVATIAAINRFKALQGHLPETLQQLLDAGCLPTLPADPHSNGPMVYRKTNEGFTLYSLGDDLTDDGDPSDKPEDMLRSDTIFWPLDDYSDLYYDMVQDFDEYEPLS